MIRNFLLRNDDVKWMVTLAHNHTFGKLPAPQKLYLPIKKDHNRLLLRLIILAKRLDLFITSYDKRDRLLNARYIHHTTGYRHMD